MRYCPRQPYRIKCGADGYYLMIKIPGGYREYLIYKNQVHEDLRSKHSLETVLSCTQVLGQYKGTIYSDLEKTIRARLRKELSSKDKTV